MTCDILVPQPVIEPMSAAVEALHPNHWTAREYLKFNIQIILGLALIVWRSELVFFHICFLEQHQYKLL